MPLQTALSHSPEPISDSLTLKQGAERGQPSAGEGQKVAGQGWGQKEMSGGGGAPFPSLPPFGRGSSGRLPKEAPSLTHPFSIGGALWDCP